VSIERAEARVNLSPRWRCLLRQGPDWSTGSSPLRLAALRQQVDPL